MWSPCRSSSQATVQVEDAFVTDGDTVERIDFGTLLADVLVSPPVLLLSALMQFAGMVMFAGGMASLYYATGGPARDDP